MQEVDITIKIKSASEENVEWTKLSALPEDEEFTKHFQVKDFSYRKMRKIVVYMTLVTRLHINRLKYGEQVKEHLFCNNIWFKPDRFETKVESSPGIITMLHPKMTNRDDYKDEIYVALQAALKNFHDQGKELDQGSTKMPTESNGFHRKTIPKFFFRNKC